MRSSSFIASSLIALLSSASVGETAGEIAQTDPVITGEPPAAAGEAERPANIPPAQAAPPSPAADAPPRGPRPQAPAGTPLTDRSATSKTERLDALFGELKKASTHPVAARVASRIEAEWSDSGSATVDLMLIWAAQAMTKDQKAAALDLIEQAIILRPDYAESWNRRATLHYVSSDFGKSLVDIEKTLSLEPRHYGALMGLGMILEETDRKDKALETYMRVLDVYPANKGAQDAVARLSEELSGQPI